MAEMIEIAKIDLAAGKYSRQKAIDWSALDKTGNKSRQQKMEVEERNIKRFLLAHNPKTKPIVQTEKQKIAKLRASQHGFEKITMRSSINEIK